MPLAVVSSIKVWSCVFGCDKGKGYKTAAAFCRHINRDCIKPTSHADIRRAKGLIRLRYKCCYVGCTELKAYLEAVDLHHKAHPTHAPQGTKNAVIEVEYNAAFAAPFTLMYNMRGRGRGNARGGGGRSSLWRPKHAPALQPVRQVTQVVQ
jgi:hypothetical protein